MDRGHKVKGNLKTHGVLSRWKHVEVKAQDVLSVGIETLWYLVYLLRLANKHGSVGAIFVIPHPLLISVELKAVFTYVEH